ncbi:PREDICTED: recQ-mediated genome instability protein 1 isoform X2 [Ipomoea nil]|uniref:recQ-mediated genome instability protein 1 isoform X2 n=1 Tax=Ipomoea nil TaxID=35883 RepID=UPI000901F2B2|nr:PREDICTED: recQ-mediated genome instability protein 1 isoform X2 [Ipomoea nil]
MSTMRRRHRIVCSSDEEDEEEVAPQPRQPPRVVEEDDSTTANLNFETVTLNSPAPPTPPPSSEVADCAVGRVLQEMGLRLRVEWLQSCLAQLEGSIRGFRAFDDATKAKLCFQQFLYSDMNLSGAGELPLNVHTLHSVDLKGPFVLQVDEIVNISCPLRGRYQESSAGIKRCLKLSMTDGMQRVFGMEYRPIKGLDVMAPAGTKVAICNVNVRHGLLMLVPEVFEILGGMVEELEGVRQRLVKEVNKPPRGKRTRNGVVPPLATRLTRAAWPVEGASAPECPDAPKGSDRPPLYQERGTLSGTHASNRFGDVAAPIRREDAETDLSFVEAMDISSIPASNRVAALSRRVDAESGLSPMEAMHASSTAAVSWGDVEASISREDTEIGLSPIEVMDVEESHMVDIETMSTIPSSSTTGEDIAVSVHTEDSAPISLPNGAMDAEDIDSIDAGIVSDTLAQGRTQSNIPVHITTVDSEDELPTEAIDAEEVCMADELEHPYILTGDKEIPFTYMACLSAKWAAAKDKTSSVKGKIKGFRYQRRSTYELRVYVDDGSLISEILIDHNVVQKGTGYSPMEVTNALASSDIKQQNDMKETMKQFQRFLENFEGTMIVEMNKESPFPVATEMNQGCPASDAWLLLRRLQSFTSVQLQPHRGSDTIHLSP